MKKLFSLFLCLTLFGQAFSSFAQSTCQGWPANYGGVMLQGFWWDSYEDTKWSALTERADELSQYFDLIWIPNAGTTAGGKWNEKHDVAGYPNDMGYMPCMWFEYNTCFGTEDELRTMIATYKAKGTGIIEDVVINHKNGYEGWWWFYPEEKTVDGKTYTLTWDNKTWTGICRNDEANYNDDSGIKGKLDGNDDDTGDGFDGCRDLNHQDTLVQQNIITYQDYLLNVMGFAGFRLDMVKGYNPSYTGIYNNATNPTFSVGEFWDANKESVKWWIDGTGKTSAAFDFPLKYTLNEAISNGNYGALADKSYTADPAYSRYSVTFADNHDTFREESCPLKNNWSAANAFILAMPGTPCIFYKHYQADPTSIGAMILARKACGITNQCTIKEQYSVYNDGYVLRTEGTSGSVIVHLGSAAGYGTPEGYTLVASGDSYKFYSRLSQGTSTIYFANTNHWDDVYCYTWTGNDKQLGEWPGTKLNKNEEGYYTATLADVPVNVIFNNGKDEGLGKEQTANLTYTPDHIYSPAGDAGIEYIAEAYKVANIASDTYTVYFDNTSAWSKVYAYVWSGETPKVAWPGEEITSVENGKYVYSFDSQYSNIIFHNGSGTQTADLKTSNYQIYNGGGKTGEIMFSNNGNTLIFTNDASHSNNDNYIVKNAGNYTCHNLVLSDNAEFSMPFGFQAEAATYSRLMPNEWGTIVVPFAINYNQSNGNYKLFKLAAATSDALTFSEFEDGIIAAGTPMAIEAVGAKNDETNKYEVTLTASSTTVNPAITTPAEVGSLTLTGSFGVTDISDKNGYIIANNKFWSIQDIKGSQKVYSAPFRAYIESSSTNSASALRILVDENETGIECIDNASDAEPIEVFDMNGRRINSLQHGMNIVKRGDKTLKVIIK